MAEQQPEPRAALPVGGAVPASPQSSVEETPPGALMEEVLRQTLQSAEPNSAEDEAEAAVLRGVAVRCQGRPFELEPVAVGLVEAMLRARFSETLYRGSTWHSMSQQIAQRLYEDPLSRGRLETLWTRLTGGPG